jgi:hypothetical protein
MTTPGQPEHSPYSPYEQVYVYPAPEPPREPFDVKSLRGDVIAFLICLAACLVVGVVAGFLWEHIAPRVPLIANRDGDVFAVAPEAEDAVGQDGWLAVLTVAAGLLLAPLAFWKLRRYGVGTALGLGLGGLAGAYLAYKVGHWVGPDAVAEQVKRIGAGKKFEQPFELRAKGVLYLWPMASLVVFLGLCAGFGDSREQRKPYGFPPPEAATPMPQGPDLTKR